MEFIAGAHGSDDGDAVFPGIGCQGQLGCHGVDGVQDAGNGLGRRELFHDGFKERVQVMGEHELFAGNHQGVRAHVSDFLLHHKCLRASDGTVEGNALPVDVGKRNHIVINQHQAADPAPGQSLRRM